MIITSSIYTGQWRKSLSTLPMLHIFFAKNWKKTQRRASSGGCSWWRHHRTS
ncbi:hypothetical protein LguiA_006148 [Lonicera macranthoides]